MNQIKRNLTTLIIGGMMCSTMLSSGISLPANAAESTIDVTIVLEGLPDPSGLTVTLTGETMTYTAVADAEGNAVFENVLSTDSDGNSLTYRITKDIPDGYVSSSWTDVTLPSGQSITIPILYTEGTYEMTLGITDADTGTTESSGDATLAGGIYTLYHNGMVYDTYTTTEDGTICDIFLNGTAYKGEWVIEMNEAPEGYLMMPLKEELTCYDEETQSEVPLVSYFPKYSSVSLYYSLLPIEGKLHIKASAGDEIQVYLESSGSYDACKETERAALTIEEGSAFASTGNLPYGTYVIENITDGKTMTAKIEKNGSVVPVEFEEYISEYMLLNRNNKVVGSGNCFDETAPLPLPADYMTDQYYILAVAQGNRTDTLIPPLVETYIILHPDGSYTHTEQFPLMGDLNEDGAVSMLDAVLLQKYLIQKAPLTSEAIRNADCMADGKINVFDLAALKARILS